MASFSTHFFRPFSTQQVVPHRNNKSTFSSSLFSSGDSFWLQYQYTLCWILPLLRPGVRQQAYARMSPLNRFGQRAFSTLCQEGKLGLGSFDVRRSICKLNASKRSRWICSDVTAGRYAFSNRPTLPVGRSVGRSHESLGGPTPLFIHV